MVTRTPSTTQGVFSQIYNTTHKQYPTDHIRTLQQYTYHHYEGTRYWKMYLCKVYSVLFKTILPTFATMLCLSFSNVLPPPPQKLFCTPARKTLPNPFP